MTALAYIQQRLDLPSSSITATLQLLKDDCSIPFISRYRKDVTGNLDEVAIENIVRLNRDFDQLEKRRESILHLLREQEVLTPLLEEKLLACGTLQEMEDLYLPYKKRKKTRADVARERGLEPLAKIIMAQRTASIDGVAARFLTAEVPDREAAFLGARDIIAEWINENQYVRKAVRRLYQRTSVLSSKQITRKEATPEELAAAEKYRQYFDWQEPLHKAPPHRLLAMLRGENEGYLRVKTEVNTEALQHLVEQNILKNPEKECALQISKAISDSIKQLLAPAISNEVMAEAKVKADLASIQVFASNLHQLLMAPPLGQKRILGIDPGFRSGCKIVCIDEKGDLLHNETIYPHPPQQESHTAIKKIRSLANAYKIEAIAIGNGTASRETEAFIKKVPFDHPVQVFVVNEAGASVYSASKIGREEFPSFDVTVRGAVSIARRLADPLAELVKIDPKAIGVGQYQHDVDQGLLRQELDLVVIRCVNSVGVNLNTAGKHLLAYVSGIGEKLAANIVAYRMENGLFTDRNQLKKVPRLGEKAFQQAAGFLRIPGAKNPLDASAVHPEAYALVQKMALDLQLEVSALIANAEAISKINPSLYVNGDIGIHTINDIIAELKKPGLDPRKSAKVLEFDDSIRTIADLRPGMILPGIVNNITHFGCFVDIGIKESGLVHISQLREGFVKDVNEVVTLHQHVRVRVTDVDQERRRIQLSMIL